MGVREIIVRMMFSYNNIIRLMKMGIDLDRRYNKDNTMLMICCKYNMKKEAGLLIKNGANLNLQDDGGKTALHIAIRFEAYDIAEMLIKNGARLDISDILGRMPIHYAAISNARQIVDLLAQYGANVDEQDVFGETALFKAISYGKCDVVDALIEKSENLNLSDEFGTTPLHLSVMSKDEVILNKLLKKDVDTNKTNNFGQTPLAFAVKKGYTRIAKTLIKNHAKLNMVSRYARADIVDEACMKGYVDMVSMLIENGANITRYLMNWAVSRGECNLIKTIKVLDKNTELKENANEEIIVKDLLKRGKSFEHIERFAVYNNKTERLREALKLAHKYNSKLRDRTLVYKAVKNNNENMSNILLRELTSDSVGALEYLLNDESLNHLLDKKITSDTRERIKIAKRETERDCILNCIYSSRKVSDPLSPIEVGTSRSIVPTE